MQGQESTFDLKAFLLEALGETRLEKVLGLGNATIRNWSVSSPSAEKLKKVADYFGTTVDDLLQDSSESLN